MKLAGFAPTQNYQQAGLVAYQDDDNYLQVTRIYEHGNRVTFAKEFAGVALNLQSKEESAAPICISVLIAMLSDWSEESL